MAWARAATILASALLIAIGAQGQTEADEPWFHEVSQERGINFQHIDGRSGLKYYIESIASGGGWLDFDLDGDLDLYLINGAYTPGSSQTGEAKPRNALYENRDGRFVEVSQKAGVADESYGMGLCVGDVDADGHLDFLVTNFGPDRLYRGLGDGRFRDIAPKVGLAEHRWSSSCSFGDLDGDGDLDLVISRYVAFTFAANPLCTDPSGDLRLYCRPAVLDGVPTSLYLQQADGTFRAAGKERGLAQEVSEKGLGVLLSDLDLDGDLDIYIANDGTMNRLYRNDGKGQFEDHSLISGAGLNLAGLAEASMGLDAGDVDGDGWPDLVASHYSLESNTLYRGLGQAQFDDVSRRSGIGPPSHKLVGWGLTLSDFDNDSDLDLAVANGHTEDRVAELEPSLSYAQPNLLLENLGQGRFRDISPMAGKAFVQAKVSRGLAVGDFDDDGRLDLLLTHTNDRAELLHNQHPNGHRWLGLNLVGPPRNRLALGAQVWMRAGDSQQWREVRSGGSFQSQNDLRLHFGLGNHKGPVSIEIRWPDGHTQEARSEQLDRYWTLHYSTGSQSKPAQDRSQ